MDAKKAYEAPKAEVIRFEADDVITASPVAQSDTRLPVQSPAPSFF